MHGALRELGGFEIDVRWELMQRDAFGNDTFEELMAIKEEEDIAKELRLKEHKLLQEKQGYYLLSKTRITASLICTEATLSFRLDNFDYDEN